jgi:predicted aldo/keto reductase-like oxidoreductase
MEKNGINRRKFIERSSLAAATITAGSLFPLGCSSNKSKLSTFPSRILGKTGERISILGYGGGSQFMRMPDGEWEPHLKYAIDAGINYFDTASTYGANNAKPSEERFGEILPPYRKKIILLTKIHDRDPEKARKEFERSLKRLKTDYVDILLIHAIRPEDTLPDIEKGVYQVISELQNQKLVRYIGFSSMDSAERSQELIENLDFDVTLLSMNPTSYGNFVDITLPAARKKDLGIIAMKVMRDIVNVHARPKELIEYAWNLEGVHCALISHTGMKPLKENINLAREYKKQLPVADKSYELERRLRHLAGPEHLVYARPGYRDGYYA